MRCIVDIEGDGLLDELTKIWCLVARDIETKKYYTFIRDENYKFFPDLDAEQHKLSEFKNFSTGIDEWIGHNFVDYDARGIERILGIKIPLPKITDTLVLSRILKPVRQGGHSLEAWGLRLNCPKGEHKEFDKFSKEMLKYCVGDVRLNHKVYDYLIRSAAPFSKTSIRLEHNVRSILDQAEENGFKLDEERATKLMATIQPICNKIEAEVQRDYPPVKVYTKRLYPRMSKNGAIHGQDAKTIEKNIHETGIDQNGKMYYDFYEMREFNLGSTKDVRERMYEAGWEPTVFKKLTDSQKAKGMTQGNPELCEENFSTLPDSAPQSAKNIAKWWMLRSRLTTIKGWFENLNPKTGCVHGHIIEVGANTHRMAHNQPNMANISKVRGLKKEFKTVEELREWVASWPKAEIMEVNEGKLEVEYLGWGDSVDYTTDMRACWISRDPKNRCIVGIDLSGIQLRGFAHYARNKEYMDQILSGDIHSHNREILKRIITEFCETAGLDKELVGFLMGNDKKKRNYAKTFIYAYLFGAGNKKIGTILEFPAKHLNKAGKYIKEEFVHAITGLDEFKEEIAEAAERGYMVALDGRLIELPNDHYAFSIYLQSFESIILKYALVLMTRKIRERGLDALLVAVVHDETQWDVARKDAEAVGKLMVECIEEAGRTFKSRIPLTGEWKIGNNWAESH